LHQKQLILVLYRHFRIPKSKALLNETIHYNLIIGPTLAFIVVAGPKKEEGTPDAVGMVL